VRIKQKEFKDLVGFGSKLLLEWPVATRHRISAGKIQPHTSDTRITFPLLENDLFLSFARLGNHGEPSEKSILRWVDKHGLLRAKQKPQFETLEKWGTWANEEVIEPAPITLQEFRTEVRTAYQLMTLYRDIRARDAEAVINRFVDPPDLWPHASPSLVDKHVSNNLEAASKKYQVTPEHAGKKQRANVEETRGVNVEATYLHAGLDILIRCVNRKLWDVRPWLEWNWWDVPSEASTSIGLERWWICPDLLSAMYLQFYLLVTDKTPMRICANPNCRMPFPAKPTHRKFCKDGCRSTGRNYPH